MPAPESKAEIDAHEQRGRALQAYAYGLAQYERDPPLGTSELNTQTRATFVFDF